MSPILFRTLPCLVTALLMTQTYAYSPDKEAPVNELSCSNNPALQKIKSDELLVLVKQDQDDRKNMGNMTPDQILKLAKDDLARREKVGAIFAAGCLNSSADYNGAALIYQHGDVPDHYYQAYIWANKAGEIDKSPFNSLAALAADRYLISIGKKQLFGSQLYNSNILNPETCFCMQPVEPSYPDSERIKYSGHSLSQSYEMLTSLNQGKSCMNQPVDCETGLKPSLRGSVPGLW
tara:strand:- start:524 stop:1228 length:705 start_codon:yes stop_codon:yes gene_type:complete